MPKRKRIEILYAYFRGSHGTFLNKSYFLGLFMLKFVVLFEKHLFGRHLRIYKLLTENLEWTYNDFVLSTMNRTRELKRHVRKNKKCGAHIADYLYWTQCIWICPMNAINSSASEYLYNSLLSTSLHWLTHDCSSHSDSLIICAFLCCLIVFR